MDNLNPEENQNLSQDFLLVSAIHDIKNTLGVVIEGLEWLSFEIKKKDSQDIEGEISKLKGSSHVLNQELMTLLTWYKLFGNNYIPVFKKISVADFFEDAILSLKPIAEWKNKSISISNPGKKSLDAVFLNIDFALFGMAFKNALRNSCDYASKNIILEIQEDSKTFNLKIIDDGPGFSPDNQSQAPKSKFSTRLGLFFVGKVIKNIHKGDSKTYNKTSEDAKILGAIVEFILPK